MHINHATRLILALTGAVFVCLGAIPAPGPPSSIEDQKIREAYLDQQSKAFDWCKLHVEPGKWLTKRVTLEGWLGIRWGAAAQVAEVYLYENPEALHLDLERRCVELNSITFLDSLKGEGITSEAQAAMLAGKCVQIEGTLKESIHSGLLAELDDKIVLRIVGERIQEPVLRFESSK